MSEEQEFSHYDLPLSTPKGSDLDLMLQRLIAGINEGTLNRHSVELTEDRFKPGWFEISIEFNHISIPSSPLDVPDKARHFG